MTELKQKERSIGVYYNSSSLFHVSTFQLLAKVFSYYNQFPQICLKFRGLGYIFYSTSSKKTVRLMYR